MKLILTKYTYSESANIEEINIFGDAVPSVSLDLDLTDYLLSEGLQEIEYSIKQIDNNNSLYYEASNVSLQCIGYLPGQTNLFEYFELNNQNYRIRFLLKIYDDNNEFVYSASIHKDNITIESIPNNILTILCVGLEKEFSEYYKNKTLVQSSDIVSETIFVLNFAGNRLARLTEVLRKNFPNVPFYFDIDNTDFIRSWYVAMKPYTYSPSPYSAENNLYHIPAGYESFARDDMDRYSYLNDLCLCMGWYWYFRAGIIYISRLSDNTYNELIIDCNNELIEMNFSNTISNSTINSIIIKGGEIYGTPDGVLNYSYVGYKYYLGINKVFKYSINDTTDNFSRSFKSLTFHSAVGGGYYSVNTTNHRFNKDTEDSELNYQSISVQTYVTNEVDESKINYRKLNTVYLNPYVCSQGSGGDIRTTNARDNTGGFYGNGNSYSWISAENNYSIRYTGTVGESLLRYDTAINKYIDYNYYTNTKEFIDNIKTYLVNSGNNIYTIRLKRLITDIRYIVNLNNFSYLNFSGIKFLITKLKYNLISGISELTLQQSGD